MDLMLSFCQQNNSHQRLGEISISRRKHNMHKYPFFTMALIFYAIFEYSPFMCGMDIGGLLQLVVIDACC